MKTKPVQERLPAMPGPSQELLEAHERFMAALDVIHSAFASSTEALPGGFGISKTSTYGQRIKGDHIQITFQPGKSQG